MLAFPGSSFLLGTLRLALPIWVVKVAAFPAVSTRTAFHPTEAMTLFRFTNRHRIPRRVSSSLKLLLGSLLPSRLNELTGNANEVLITRIRVSNFAPLVVGDVFADAGVIANLV